jgi:hypothetical protein
MGEVENYPKTSLLVKCCVLACCHGESSDPVIWVEILVILSAEAD